MRRALSAVLGVWITTTTIGMGATAVKIIKDGQGAYARAEEGSKFTTLPVGTVLSVREETSNGWIKVVPPPSVGCWIFGDTVHDGQVSSGIGRLRTAPNPTAPVVASLRRGDKVTVLGKEGEWVKVAPPATASIWVQRASVAETSEAPTKAKPVVIPQPKPVVLPEPVVETSTPKAEVVSQAPVIPPPPPVWKPEPVKEVIPVPTPEPKKVESVAVAPVIPVVEDRKEELPPPVVISEPRKVSTDEPAKSRDVVVVPQEESVRKPVRSVGASPASGNTVVWPVTPKAPVVTPVQTPQPQSKPVAVTPASAGGGWEDFQQESRQRGGERRVIRGTIYLPRRAYASNWEEPSSGTLLRRKKKTSRHIVSAVPSVVSVDRLRSDVYQGEQGCAHGVLVRETGGFRMKPSDYSLQVLHGNGKSELVAYVVGTDAQLGPYVGMKVEVVGTCWWLGDSAAALSPTEPLRKVQ